MKARMMDSSICNDNSNEEEQPADVKLIIIGDSAVGKSKIIERYLINDYNQRQSSTYALNVYRKVTVLGDGKELKVDIWDTAGQERFNSMHPSYYYLANVCILVFDVTRKQTYKNLKIWYQELREHCQDIPCILVANKIDVDLKVTSKNFKFAGQNQIPFFFVSSADGTNIVKVFEEAICAGLGHKQHDSKGFLSECLELFDDDE